MSIRLIDNWMVKEGDRSAGDTFIRAHLKRWTPAAVFPRTGVVAALARASEGLING